MQGVVDLHGEGASAGKVPFRIEIPAPAGRIRSD
jgi:hypothetical protein